MTNITKYKIKYVWTKIKKYLLYSLATIFAMSINLYISFMLLSYLPDTPDIIINIFIVIVFSFIFLLIEGLIFYFIKYLISKWNTIYVPHHIIKLDDSNVNFKDNIGRLSLKRERNDY